MRLILDTVQDEDLMHGMVVYAKSSDRNKGIDPAVQEGFDAQLCKAKKECDTALPPQFGVVYQGRLPRGGVGIIFRSESELTRLQTVHVQPASNSKCRQICGYPLAASYLTEIQHGHKGDRLSGPFRLSM